MFKNVIQLIYPYLGIRFQNVICSAYGKLEGRDRFGTEFSTTLKTLEESEWWHGKKIEAFQLEQFNSILEYAKEHVPFYRSRTDYPGTIESLEDVHNFPVLSKTTFREHAGKLLSDEFELSQLSITQTSGTTGKPVTIYRTPSSISKQWAVWSRHKQRFGVKYNDYHALFTGKPIVPGNQTSPPFWRHNRPMNQLIFGMLHTTSANIKYIINQLEKEPIRFYTGYPSIIYEIAATAVNSNLSLTSGPEVIFTGAEPLHPHQKVVIEQFFGATVTDQYGTSEGVANASKCEFGEYHEDFEFGYLEVVPDGLSEDPEVGEILMTGFTNRAMPLLRYAIGDRGKMSRTTCACGRQSRILTKLSGRSEDFVLTPEGNGITRFDYVFKGVNGLDESQITQYVPGEIVITLVVNDLFDTAEQDKIIKGVAKFISKSLVVNLEFANSIPRSSTGKFRAVVNKLRPA